MHICPFAFLSVCKSLSDPDVALVRAADVDLLTVSALANASSSRLNAAASGDKKRKEKDKKETKQQKLTKGLVDNTNNNNNKLVTLIWS